MKKGNHIIGAKHSIKGFIKHIHPKKIPLGALALNRTWALGGSCMVLFSLLAGSGFLMLFAYHPAPEFAYASIKRLEQEMIFGSLIRNILVITVLGEDT